MRKKNEAKKETKEKTKIETPGSENEEILAESKQGVDLAEPDEQDRLWAEFEEEKARLVGQMLRLKADFENFRRRSQAQEEKLVSDANERLLRDLLPVLDNFQRALNSTGLPDGEEDSFYRGMEMVFQGLWQILENYGLSTIAAQGQPFDPDFHEAISAQGEGDGTPVVLEEIQTGYILHGKVIRHTKVLVGRSEEEE